MNTIILAVSLLVAALAVYHALSTIADTRKRYYDDYLKRHRDPDA